VYGLKHADSLRKIVREAAQRWPRLQELRFIGCAAAAVLPDLAAQPLLHLQELELSECDLAKEDVALLATLHAPRLRELDLSASGVPCLDALSSSNWPRLAALSLCANPRLGVPAALSLAAETFPRLADLDLSGTMLLPAAVAALVAAPLPMLEWLRLSECRLSDEALLPLASASWPRLQLLDLAHNNLRSDAAMQYLATAELPNLWSLDISGNSDLHASALQALSTARWPRLERFSASYLPLSSKGVSGLIAAEMPRLAVLTLYECTMPWVAVDRLASAKNWPCLRRLNLGGSCSGVQGRRAGPSLAVAEWPSLKTLVLRQTKMSSVKAKTAVRREQMQLRERWPDLKILYE